MARCAYCGTTILFGGKAVEGLRFCNDKCLSNGQAALVARRVPDDVVATQARSVHAGACPVCGRKRGPVDVHTSHKISSFIFMTSWSSTPRISCTTCGKKAQLGALVHSLLLGWWGVPWGLLLTPVQVVKNLIGLLRSETSTKPSEQLKQLIRMGIASQTLAAGRQPAK
jgi:DNA-directed RNA polymerase subunit RPC12/RpoP